VTDSDHNLATDIGSDSVVIDSDNDSVTDSDHNLATDTGRDHVINCGE
jgi:hypothetical protein